MTPEERDRQDAALASWIEGAIWAAETWLARNEGAGFGKRHGELAVGQKRRSLKALRLIARRLDLTERVDAIARSRTRPTAHRPVATVRHNEAA